MTGRADQSFSHVADGVSEVRHAARKQLHRGVDAITVFATSGVTYEPGGPENVDYSGEELRAIVEIATEGRRRGARAHSRWESNEP